MFWGLIMEPNKRYTQVVEKPFHISQAALDTSTGDNDACQVMVVVDGKNFLVCTLQKNKTIQTPLDLYFKTGDSISFLTNGKCNVHLTGYLDPEFEEEPSDEEDEEEEEDAPALVQPNNKRKLEANHTSTVSKKVKPDKKSAKKAAAADDSSDDEEDDGENHLQKLLDGEDIDTDDNDESFNMNTSTEPDDSEDDEDEDQEEEDDDDSSVEEPKQKKSKNSQSSETDTTLDSSKEEGKIDMSKLTKSQKRRLKKKLQQQAKAQQQPQLNGVEKAKKEDGKPKEKADKKKPEKPEVKVDGQDGQAADKKEKKSLSGGVAIEDMKVGSGPVAKPGKVVMVYYEGRLKQNNKMFDNCLKGPGFKFRLGSKEVISGWDVGIAGMKVGGKRKIICPPAMAYGAKGSPPVIPPNSTLVFEVELKNVK